MSEQPLFKTTLSKEVRKRLWIKLIGAGVLVGSVFYTDGFDLVWLQWVGAAIVFVFMVGQLLILVNGRRPMSLFDTHVEFATLFKSRIPRDMITGLALHPKTGDPGLSVMEPTTGNDSVLRLPWRFIAEDRENVLQALQTHYGLNFEVEQS